MDFNAAGSAPCNEEVFIDEGKLDKHRVILILKETGFDGALIPDPTPQMSCAALRHAGMAYAMSYMHVLLKETL